MREPSEDEILQRYKKQFEPLIPSSEVLDLKGDWAVKQRELAEFLDELTKLKEDFKEKNRKYKSKINRNELKSEEEKGNLIY